MPDDSYSSGFYIKYFFSNALTTTPPDLTELKRADSALRVTYDSNKENMRTFLSEGIYKILLFTYNDNTSTQASQTYQNARTQGGTSHLQNLTESYGAFVFSPLTNGTAVNVALATVNKFQFLSPLSESQIQTEN